MKNLLLVVCAFMLFAPAVAIDEGKPSEAFVFYGYDWGDAAIADNSTFGLGYEHVFPDHGGWGVMVLLGRTGSEFYTADLDVTYLDLSATYTVAWSRAKVYVPFGIGTTDSDGPGSASASGMSAHAGVGYKFSFTDRLGLRVDGRYRYIRELVDSTEGKNIGMTEVTVGLGWSW